MKEVLCARRDLMLLWLVVSLVLSVGIAPRPIRADAALPNKFLYAIAYTAPAGEFDQPEAVADGVVYVADTGNHHIQRFTAEGEMLGLWGSWGEGEGQFDSPTGLTVAPDGSVYFADTWKARIRHYSATGDLLHEWGSWGDDQGEFNRPQELTVAPNGALYLSDGPERPIQVFAASYPASWRAEYYANPYLAGAPLPEDGFSARYTRVISFPAGLYRFTLADDDGARLWVGDRLVGG